MDSIWNCQANLVDLLDKPLGAVTDAVTVGQRLALLCEGQPVAFGRDPLQLILPETQKYDLKLLKVLELKEDSAKLVVTTYRAAEKIQFPNLVLSDGQIQVGLRGFELQVQSVIDPKTNPEGKAYGPYDPLMQKYPLYLWLGIGLLLIVVVRLLWQFFSKARTRRQWQQELERHGSSLSPYHQFNKDLRHLATEHPLNSSMETSKTSSSYLQGLSRAYLWYVASELQLPAHKWSRKMTLKEVRKRHRNLFRVCKEDLLLALRELDKASQTVSDSRGGISSSDLLKLTEICRRSVEQIRRTRNAEKAKGA